MKFSRIGQRTAILLLIGCSFTQTQASPEASTMTLTQTVHIQSTKDLGLSIHMALQEQILASQSGPATFEVVLAPGTYEGIGLSLRDGSDESNLEIVVRGAGPGPTIFKSPIQIHAARIRLENLVIADTIVGLPVTILKVGDSLQIDGVSWVGNRHEEPNIGDPIVAIKVGYSGGPKDITVTDTWFVGNDNGGQSNLIDMKTLRSDIVSSLSFKNSVFVDNHCSVVVNPESFEEVNFDQTMIHETTSGAFLWIRSTGTQARFNGGLFAYGGGGAAIRYQRSQSAAPSDFHAAVFSDIVPTLTAAKSNPGLVTYAEQQARAGAKPDRSGLEKSLN